MEPKLSSELRVVATELEASAGPVDVDNPARRRIGAGGTLVAVSRKLVVDSTTS